MMNLPSQSKGNLAVFFQGIFWKHNWYTHSHPGCWFVNHRLKAVSRRERTGCISNSHWKSLLAFLYLATQAGIKDLERGWKDSSVVKSTCCFHAGPWFSSKPHVGVTHTAYKSSLGIRYLWLRQALCECKCVGTHKDTIKSLRVYMYVCVSKYMSVHYTYAGDHRSHMRASIP